jgi:hypothetical protein
LSLPSESSKDIDVIYFYPTAYSKGEGDDFICDIDSKSMHQIAPRQLKAQASVFSTSCNIYAPYYRQVDANYALTVSIEDNEKLFRYLASTDPTTALNYYFELLNQGRPYILAGHSQGSEILTMLLADYMKEHPNYYKNMVAAYVIGYSVTKAYFSKNTHLKFATGETDTGVIISYNTEGPNNANAHNLVVLDGAISINPLNWKLDNTYAGVESNLGSLQGDGTLGKGIANAQLNTERGVVVCSSVDPNVYAMSEQYVYLFGKESYHSHDYGFYYGNIQDNVAKRIEAFKQK